MQINVLGLPAPQGSKRHVGHGIMVESSKKVKPWRQDVKYAVLETDPQQIPGAINIRITFYLPRPKGHYRTGRNAALLRDAAPTRPASTPDLDKLIRSTLDALTESGIFHDDSQVVTIKASKWYADTRPPGAVIDVQTADVTGSAQVQVRAVSL